MTAPQMASLVGSALGRTPSKNTCREALERLVAARRATRAVLGRFPAYVHPALAQARDVIDAADPRPQP